MDKNIKSLPNLAVEQGPNGGWEFAKLSFPCWHLAPHLCGCQLPDAMGHGSGVFGLCGRVGRHSDSRTTELSSEAFKLASVKPGKIAATINSTTNCKTRCISNLSLHDALAI